MHFQVLLHLCRLFFTFGHLDMKCTEKEKHWATLMMAQSLQVSQWTMTVKNTYYLTRTKPVLLGEGICRCGSHSAEVVGFCCRQHRKGSEGEEWDNRVLQTSFKEQKRKVTSTRKQSCWSPAASVTKWFVYDYEGNDKQYHFLCLWLPKKG